MYVYIVFSRLSSLFLSTIADSKTVNLICWEWLLCLSLLQSVLTLSLIFHSQHAYIGFLAWLKLCLSLVRQLPLSVFRTANLGGPYNNKIMLIHWRHLISIQFQFNSACVKTNSIQFQFNSACTKSNSIQFQFNSHNLKTFQFNSNSMQWN